MVRSMRITGMPAVRISRSTNSQPVSTTGEKAIASTRCLTNARSATIWFCWLRCASSICRSMPASRAALRMDSVLALSQLASAVTWLKPRTILGLPSAGVSRAPSEQLANSDSSASKASEFVSRARRLMSVSEACTFARPFNKSRTATEIYSFVDEAIQEGQIYRYQVVRVVVVVEIHRRKFVLRRMEDVAVLGLLGERVDGESRNLPRIERLRIRRVAGPFEVDARERYVDDLRDANERD